jgi:glycosyltransferase involved in cell wall biosynthesis
LYLGVCMKNDSENIDVLVSVRVITFNHEKFIRQCLDSIIAQKTSFNFEIVVGDDCSTDSTKDILLEYGVRYPSLIRNIFRGKNVGSNLNIHLTNMACSGKYIAWCDGDDYWIDENKMQLQFDFLETHPDFAICFHNAWKIDDNAPAKRKEFNPRLPEFKVFQPEDIFKTWLISNSSVIYRNGIITENCPPFIWNGTHGDLISFMFLSRKGKIGFINKLMSVYRIHGQSITKSAYSGIEHNELHISQCLAFNEFLNFKFNKLIRRHVAQYHLSSAYCFAKENNRKEALKKLKLAFLSSALSVLLSFIQIIKLFVFLLPGVPLLIKTKQKNV